MPRCHMVESSEFQLLILTTAIEKENGDVSFFSIKAQAWKSMARAYSYSAAYIAAWYLVSKHCLKLIKHSDPFFQAMNHENLSKNPI